jgi:hypothetical protein
MGEQAFDPAAVQVLPAARWAASRAGGRPLLDTTSPSGLVARFLGPQGVEVVTVVSSAAVAEALGYDLRGAATVRSGALAELPFPPRSFGAAVCLVRQFTDSPLDRTLSELRRVLDGDGVLVICDRAGRGRGDGPTMHDLEQAVSRQFKHSAVLNQTDHVVSTVAGDDSDGLFADLSVTTIPGHISKGAFVAASDSPEKVSGAPIAFVDPIDLDGLTALWDRALQECVAAQARATEAQRAAEERDRLIRELFLAEQALAEAFDVSRRLEGMAETASEQRIQLRSVRSQLEAAKSDAEAAHAEIARLLEANQNAHEQVMALRESTSWRVTKPLRAVIGTLRSAPGDQ